MYKNNSVLKNFFWRLAERVGAQGVTFVVSIVLARILDPKVYGMIALVTVFTSIMQVFVDSGLGNALIQKKDADDLDFSTVFYFNIIICALLYLVMFLLAPLIARFYNIPELTAVVRVLSLTLIISGVKNIQQAYVSRNMLFKRFFFATLGGTIGAAVIGIWMAVHGFGIWALVTQHIFNAAVDTIILWITVKWRPKRLFSFERLKSLFSYGWKLLVSKLIDTIYTDLRQLIIGKKYSSEDLAFYNRGNQLPHLFITNVNSSIDSVLFPTMSKEQDSVVRVKEMTRRSIKTSTYIIAPFLMGLAACGDTLVRLVLTEKWLPCVPFMTIFCITYMFYPIHTANLNAIKALGRSDLFLKLEIIKKVIGLAVMLTTMWHGVMVMAYSLLFTSVISQIINSWPNKKLLNYGYLEQLKDVLPPILIAIVMGGLVYSIEFFHLNTILTLIIQVPTGIMIYILLSRMFKVDSYEYIMRMLKKRMKRNNRS